MYKKTPHRENNYKTTSSSKTCKLKLQSNTFHKFHIVDPSPWPFLASVCLLMMTVGGVLYMHGIWSSMSFKIFLHGVIFLLGVSGSWWRDVFREAQYEDCHTVKVQRGLRLGVILFIVSEVMFFFGFFWAFFQSSLSPTYNLGGVWPPSGIAPLSFYFSPLTNTLILLASGAAITWAHHSLFLFSKRHSIVALLYTIFFAILFTYFQGIEYKSLPFNISDGVYGSCFYMITGFHGFHVIIGTVAIIVSLVRVVKSDVTQEQHLGLESAIWYWHFVDVVWLYVFVAVYCWGNSQPTAEYYYYVNSV